MQKLQENIGEQDPQEQEAFMNEPIGPYTTRKNITLQLLPGYILLEVPGGYIIVRGANQSGKVTVQLKPGERLHPKYGEQNQKSESIPIKKKKVFLGYIIQPPGGPELKTDGVAELIGKSSVMVRNLAEAGPLDTHPGFQAYYPAGKTWEPKENANDASPPAIIMFYREDIERWLQAQPEKAEKNEKRLLNIEIPPKMADFLKRLAIPELTEKGYVTRTALLKRAIEITQELSAEDCEELIGVNRAMRERDQIYIQALALQERWPISKHRNGARRDRQPPRPAEALELEMQE